MNASNKDETNNIHAQNQTTTHTYMDMRVRARKNFRPEFTEA